MTPFDFDYFLKILTIGKHIDETTFYFSDDPDETERYLGFLPQYEQPYWVGYCDIPDGAEFYTAEELLNAKIYNGKSIKERWSTVCFITLG